MEASHKIPEGNEKDEPDASPFSLSHNGWEKVEANSLVGKEFNYNMNHKARGLAIIFNHYKFYSKKLKTRLGTMVDASRLQKSLERLGFKVNVYEDCFSQEIEEIINEASKEDHSEYDCLVVAVLSHGYPGFIHAYDHPYKADILWTKFSADNCKTLLGKPKIFFIQACQGKGLDEGITLHEPETESDSSSTYTMSLQEEDFLVAFSSIPGFISFRNKGEGSYFVESLCSMLDKKGTDYDILTLMTMVNHRMAIDFESGNHKNKLKIAKKQIPCVNSTLTRRLKFNIKAGH